MSKHSCSKMKEWGHYTKTGPNQDWNPSGHYQTLQIDVQHPRFMVCHLGSDGFSQPLHSGYASQCQQLSLVGIHIPSIYNILGSLPWLRFPLHSITQWLLKVSSWKTHPCYILPNISDFLKPWYKPPWPHHSCLLYAPNSSTFFQQTSSKDLKFMVRCTVATNSLYSTNFLNYLLFLLLGQNTWQKQLRRRKVSLGSCIHDKGSKLPGTPLVVVGASSVTCYTLVDLEAR